jgi:hypothetical protein
MYARMYARIVYRGKKSHKDPAAGASPTTMRQTVEVMRQGDTLPGLNGIVVAVTRLPRIRRRLT